jgi:hypothetical protein
MAQEIINVVDAGALLHLARALRDSPEVNALIDICLRSMGSMTDAECNLHMRPFDQFMSRFSEKYGMTNRVFSYAIQLMYRLKRGEIDTVDGKQAVEYLQKLSNYSNKSLNAARFEGISNV